MGEKKTKTKMETSKKLSWKDKLVEVLTREYSLVELLTPMDNSYSFKLVR
jgi:hypothetical protein